MVRTIIGLTLVVIVSSVTAAFGSDSNGIMSRGPVVQAENVAVADKVSVTQLEELGVYRRNHKPFFDSVVLFAANINLLDNSGVCGPNYKGKIPQPDSPCIYYNGEMSSVLQTALGRSAIEKLQHSGIRVELGILGNWEAVGWSCPMTDATINALSQQMVLQVEIYHLDGIMIDDEYSTCAKDPASFQKLLAAIKNDERFRGKVLSKALFNDSLFFTGPTNIAPLLDRGYEMSYQGYVGNLDKYAKAGMPEKSLLMGVWYNSTSEGNATGSVRATTEETMNAGYGGMMIYQPQLIPTFHETARYFGEIAIGEYGDGSVVKYSYSTTSRR